MEITQPDLTEAVSGPVRVTMAASRCIPPLVERLKEVLSEHPGTTEVHLHLTGGAKTTVLRLDDRLRVSPSPALYGDLKALLSLSAPQAPLPRQRRSGERIPARRGPSPGRHHAAAQPCGCG